MFAVHRPERLRLGGRGLALADRGVRQPRRGRRRGPRQGPGGDPAARQDRDHRTPAPRHGDDRGRARPRSCGSATGSWSSPGEVIPGDGDVVEGVASVDESAITGESAPVIRESGGDRSSVTGGTRVLSDRIVVEITAKPGESFIDRMIALVEGASRQKTPNEIALNILLASLTIVFLAATATLQPVRGLLRRRAADRRPGRAPGLPDPDHDRRAALGDRHRGHGPPGAAQRAGHVRARGRGRRRREHAAAGQDRHDHARQPPGRRVHPGRRRAEPRCSRTPPSCRAWPTRPRRVARSWSWPRPSTACASARRASSPRARFVPFTAQTRMSGVDLAGGRQIRKGAAAAVMKWVRDNGGHPTAEVGAIVDAISTSGGTPLVVAESRRRAGGTGPRRDPPQGRRQGGHARTLRGDAAHGHPHRHDHRRQPADRPGHRRGGRRRRLPGRGHARGQDGADPQGAGGRSAGRDDRRRHQRRARRWPRPTWAWR